MVAFNLSPERHAIIDFARILYEDIVTLHTVNIANDAGVNMLVFLDSLSIETWIAVAVICSLLVGYLWFYDASLTKNSLTEISAFVFLAFWERSTDYSAKFLTGKIVVLITGLLGSFLYSLYTGAITSTIISNPVPAKIETLREIADQTLNVIIWKDTMVDQQFQSAPVGSDKHKIYHQSIKGNPKAYFHSGAQAATMLQESKPRGNVFAYTEKVNLIGYTDKVNAVKGFQDIQKIYQSIGLPHGSEFTECFNFHLLKMRQAGVFDKFLENRGMLQNMVKLLFSKSTHDCFYVISPYSRILTCSKKHENYFNSVSNA